MTLKLLEGFAGIGAVAFALEELGIDYSSDIIEWNIYSTIAYAAVHHNDEYLKNKRKNETLTSKELNQYLSDNYSKEDGTPASRLKEQIHPMTKKSRYNKIMKLQQVPIRI